MHRALSLLIVALLAVSAAAEKKQPASVTIKSDIKGLKAVLFAQMTSLGYELRVDKKDRVVYAKELRMQDFPTTAMLPQTYSDPPQQLVTFRLEQREAKILVTARMEAQYRDTLGLSRVIDMSHDRVLKPEVQGILDNVNAAYLAAESRQKLNTSAEKKPDAGQPRN